MNFKIFIEKELIKLTIDFLGSLDRRSGIGQKIVDNKHYINITDTLKDKLENITGVHIDRSFEKKISGNAPTISDEEIMEHIQIYREIRKKEEAEKLRREIEATEQEVNDSILAMLCCLGWIIFFIFLFKA